MHFRERLILSIAATLFLLTSASSTSAQAQEIPIEILFDFGDGAYLWSYATFSHVNETNNTWDTIRLTAGSLGISIESAWFSCCGVAILDIGNRDPPAGFVAIYLWNRTSHRWELTSEGVTSLDLREGDVLALSNAGFDSVTFELRAPVPSPDDRFPSVMFRGNAWNRGVSISRSPDRPRTLWDRDTGVPEIGATPAVAYGRVFVTTMRGLVALDARTGDVLWNASAARGFSSPAVFDESVFVGSSNGSVYRLNATDGSIEWATPLLAETGFSGITSSPTVAFDSVFIGTFNETGGPGEVVSLWASNGTVRWRVRTGSVHFSSPAYADGSVYVGVAGRYNTTSQITFDPPYGVIALDAATGDEEWFFETSGSISASPAVTGSYLVVPSKDGNVYAVERSDGSEVWRSAVGAGVSSASVWAGTAFVGGGSFSSAGRISALNLSTGLERWSFAPNGPVQASVTYSDGKIFFATNTAQGTVYAVSATTGELAWAISPIPAQYILSSPVVANGIVFAASDNGHVYAIGQEEPVPPVVGGVPSVPLVGVASVSVVAVAVVLAVLVLRRSRRAP